MYRRDRVAAQEALRARVGREVRQLRATALQQARRAAAKRGEKDLPVPRMRAGVEAKREDRGDAAEYPCRHGPACGAAEARSAGEGTRRGQGASAQGSSCHGASGKG